MRRTRILLVLAAGLSAVSCRTSAEDPVAERRAWAQVMKEAALARVELSDPELGAKLAKGAGGWVVIGSTGAAGARERDGVGVAHESKSGTETYLAVLLPPADPQTGFESFRALIVFDDVRALRQLVSSGWNPAAKPPERAAAYRVDDFGVTSDAAMWKAAWTSDAAMGR